MQSDTFRNFSTVLLFLKTHLNISMLQFTSRVCKFEITQVIEDSSFFSTTAENACHTSKMTLFQIIPQHTRGALLLKTHDNTACPSHKAAYHGIKWAHLCIRLTAWSLAQPWQFLPSFQHSANWEEMRMASPREMRLKKNGG